MSNLFPSRSVQSLKISMSWWCCNFDGLSISRTGPLLHYILIITTKRHKRNIDIILTLRGNVILYLCSHLKYQVCVIISILWGIHLLTNSQPLKILNNFCQMSLLTCNDI